MKGVELSDAVQIGDNRNRRDRDEARAVNVSGGGYFTGHVRIGGWSEEGGGEEGIHGVWYARWNVGRSAPQS